MSKTPCLPKSLKSKVILTDASTVPTVIQQLANLLDRTKHITVNTVCFVFWSRIFVLFEPCVRFHILSSFRVTEWPPVGE